MKSIDYHLKQSELRKEASFILQYGKQVREEPTNTYESTTTQQSGISNSEYKDERG